MAYVEATQLVPQPKDSYAANLGLPQSLLRISCIAALPLPTARHGPLEDILGLFLARKASRK